MKKNQMVAVDSLYVLYQCSCPAQGTQDSVPVLPLLTQQSPRHQRVSGCQSHPTLSDHIHTPCLSCEGHVI